MEQYSERTLGLALGELLVLLQGTFAGFVVPHNESFQRAETNLGGRVTDDGGFAWILLGANCGLVGRMLLALVCLQSLWTRFGCFLDV